ncbi:hypothetical protein HY772_02255 [Candidatus Woesearchaeota archaeon]|nr:hypothetical protein [Candidatus Woesearchaeota archaeon]
MKPSNEQIAAWIRKGQRQGASELVVGLDVFFLTPTGAPPTDEDYFPVHVKPQDDRAKILQATFHSPWCSLEATYTVPEYGKIAASRVHDLQTYDLGGVPTYLVNRALYGNSFQKKR